MNFFKKIFNKQRECNSLLDKYETFWKWFRENESKYYTAIKKQDSIEESVLNPLSTKIADIKDGIYLLVGMYDENTAEIIFTAEGNPKIVPFIEALMQKAPLLANWKFTGLKSAIESEDLSLQMNEIDFKSSNMSFYANENREYPDLIDISVVHHDLTQENLEESINGIYIFLDNYLGELDFLNNIDNLKIVLRENAIEELIPMSKLKDYLIWRQKEFVEKYQAFRYDTSNDNHSMLEATLKNGNKLLAIINIDLLQWDAKVSHPWVGILEIKFDGTNLSGMPNQRDYELMNEIEDELTATLSDKDGYLNIGRQTADGIRLLFFAFKEFKKPAIIIDNVIKKYQRSFEMEFDLYKDKYWRSFERFAANP